MNATRSVTKNAESPLVNQLTGAEITGDQLKNVKFLVDKLMAVESDIAVLEASLEKLREHHRQLSTEIIPGAMDEVGLESITTNVGAIVRVKPFYSAKIPEEMHAKAFAWLRKNGHDGIIKTIIPLEFGKGESDAAREVSRILDRNKVPHELRESVHAQTLKAWVREMVEGGKKFSHAMFGAYIGKVTKVEMPK